MPDVENANCGWHCFCVGLDVGSHPVSVSGEGKGIAGIMVCRIGTVAYASYWRAITPRVMDRQMA